MISSIIRVLFRSNGSASSGTSTVKVRESVANPARVTADKITPRGRDKHEHRSYNLNKRTGSYSEYWGGENREKRSGNQKKPKKG